MTDGVSLSASRTICAAFFGILKYFEDIRDYSCPISYSHTGGWAL